MTATASATEREAQQVERANSSGRTPIVFVHGLWLLPSSWNGWADVFETAGYAAVTAGWPGDAGTVDDANAHPNALAGKDVGAIVGRLTETIGRLEQKPAIIGHSFGGLFAQMLAGRGLSAATVAISPAPFRGVLPLPLSALKSGSPVLRNPLNRGRAVALTRSQFRYAFANALSDGEAGSLYHGYAVPAPGAPLFQAAAANLNPWTGVKVDTKRADRGPLLIVSGAEDHTVPGAIAKATYKLQQRNPGVTEYAEVTGRGHALTIDSGWPEVAEIALSFIRRFV